MDSASRRSARPPQRALVGSVIRSGAGKWELAHSINVSSIEATYARGISVEPIWKCTEVLTVSAFELLVRCSLVGLGGAGIFEPVGVAGSFALASGSATLPDVEERKELRVARSLSLRCEKFPLGEGVPPGGPMRISASRLES